MIKPIAITTGEPAGIGPDIALEVALTCPDIPLVLLGDPQLLENRAAQLKRKVRFTQTTKQPQRGEISLCPVSLIETVFPGQLNSANGAYVINMLDMALTGCIQEYFSAIVTGPVHKAVLNQSGFSFCGHTEYFAKAFNVDVPVMMFVADTFKMALATTHIPIRALPDAITPSLLEKVITTLHEALLKQFYCPSPRIVVAGLNPHAGEFGLLGEEEKTVIEPVIKKLQQKGFLLEGPLAADTIFAHAQKVKADAILMMYHDQGLTAFKALSFGQGVNLTLGLPIIRASVDHGTALDLAGTGLARSDSLRQAVKLVHQLTQKGTASLCNA